MSEVLRFVIAGLGLVLATAGAGAAVSAGAVGQASRVIDRTVVCETELSGGIREISVWANSAYRQGEGKAFVQTGGLLAGSLAGLGQSHLYLDPTCRTSRTRVGFTSRGLVGGEVGTIQESVDCATPRRVLVHVRGVFRAPVRLRRTGRPPRLWARGRLLEGSLAVRTLSRQQLALARVLRSGKVQVFAAIPDSCIPD